MRILTTSGLYANGTPDEILLRLSQLAESGVAIHAGSEGCFFLPEQDRVERFKKRNIIEIAEMAPVDFLRDLEDAGHILIAEE